MADRHPIEGVMGVSMEKLHEMTDVNTIIGDPITSPDGTIVIPVSKVSFGFVSGGSDLPMQTAEKFAGGSGAGVTVKPVAFIVIKKDGDVKLMELGAKGSPVDGIIEAVPGIIDKLKGIIGKKKDGTDSAAEDAAEALDSAEKQ
ncbi:MAG: GerW family sporulation protein [Oscillospiraceae bacterium]